MTNDISALPLGPAIGLGPKQPRRERPLLPLILALLVIVTPSLVFGSQSKNVLILNSYHRGFEWTDAQVSAAEKVLLERFENIEIYVEYLDTKRYYDEAYLERLRGVFEFKYKHIKLDAIITTDDNALQFVMKYHADIFGHAPVSFCGINDYQDSMFEGREAFTGLVEVLDIRPTIDLILNLHPETRKIVVVVDGTPTGLGQRRDVAAIARQYEDIEFEYLKGEELTNDELFEKLRKLSSDSIVLLTVWLRDKNHDYLQPHKGGMLISSASSVPVYGIVDMYLGHGIVGGKLLNSRTHGKTAAEIALRLLEGETPADIPVLIQSVNPYMFDYQQLGRWGVGVDRLPQNSVVINKPFSIYEAYKTLIWTTGTILLVLVVMVVVLVGNTLKRKRAEEALRKSEELLSEMARQVPGVLYQFYARSNGEMGMYYVSDRSEQIVGLQPDCDGFFERFTEMIIPEHRESFIRSIETAVEEIGPWHYEGRLQRPTGESIWFSGHSVPSVREGEVVFNGIVQDITERMNAQAALEKSEQKLRLILDSMPDMIVEVNPEFKILWANRAALRLNPMAVGQTCHETFPGRGTICDGCYCVKALHSGKTEMGTMYQPASKTAGESYWENIGVPLKDADGNIVSVLEISRNVTDREMARRREMELQERLRQAHKMEAIGTLAGGIAHDFNNILTPILVQTELAKLSIADDHTIDVNLDEIMKAGLRAKDLVKQILTFSRQSEQNPVTMDLVPIVKDSLNLLRATIPKTIEIRQNIDQGPCIVKADPTQMQQIIMNLCANAAQAMEEMGSLLGVSLQNVELTEDDVKADGDLRPGGYVLLRVSDTGAGIPPEIIDRIFDPFFTTKPTGKGTGIGLAVVHGIVRSNGGSIRVHSEPAKGTTFEIFIPHAERESEKEEKETNDVLPTGKERILFVDDEESLVKLGEQMLERLGYRVDTSTSPVEALAAFREHPKQYDLVMTDMTMSDMTGERLAQELLQIRPDIPIIICTGFSHQMDEKKAERIGIRAFVMKPFSMKEVAEGIRKVLDTTNG